MRARFWLNVWKKKSWIRHLFGQISNPSMANRGVEKWISSLADIHASRFQLQEKNSGIETPDISGLMCGELFPRLNQCSVSLKMSVDIYSWASNKSTMTYKDWVTKLRQACSQRKKSVLRIAVSGSLSWPTVMMADATVAETITPNDKYVPTKNGTLRRYIKSGHNCSLGLARTARLWPTVVVSESKGISMKDALAGNPKSRLREEALIWGTINNWRTPNASDAEGGVMEIRPGTSARIKLRDHSVHVANCLSGHPDQMTLMTGEISQRTLNPQFTEWLMGWPIGWTELEPAATAWCLWWRRMRLQFLRLTLNLQQQVS